MKQAVFGFVLSIALCALGGEALTFSTPPRATRQQDGAVVSFAVSAPTDVEVAILDAKGKVVRHLAAGALGGESPPPPPLKPGLAQAVAWDGKDDLGEPARGGPFQARVRAGMSVAFGRMIGGSPYTGSVDQMPYRAPVNGLAVDAEGNLYVKMQSSIGSHGNSGRWPWHVRKFDKTGKYLVTLLPYPPSTDPAKATGFRLLDTGDGGLTPANENSLYPVFYVFGNEVVNRLVDGALVFVHSERRQLNFFKLDGSNALRTVTMWPPEAKLNCPRWLDIQVAFSPDGRTAYYSNVAGTAYDGKTPADVDPKWPQGRIYRQDIQAGTPPERFFDLELPDWGAAKYWMPSAWDKKTAAAGIAVDAKGNVLVCDLVNQQVVELSPEGKKLSATSVPWPDKVMVHPRTGDLYIISRGVSRGYLPPAKLSKIAGRGAQAKVVAELSLSGTVGGSFALDTSAAGAREAGAVLWLAGTTASDTKLLRVEDRGERFEITDDQLLNRDRNAIEFLGYMDVDAEAELVYVTGSRNLVWRYQGDTGEGGLVKIKAVDLAVGPGGMVYAWGTGGYAGPVVRYTRDLEPAPLEATGKHTYGSLYGRAGRGCSVCGLDVDARGRVFATWGTNDCHVVAYDAAGQPLPTERTVTRGEGEHKGEAPALITGVSGYGGSIRVDLAGNLYLVQAGLPKGFTPPRGYEKDEAYRQAVGTILKFGPKGGERSKAEDAVMGFSGVQAVYPGCGPISRWRCDGSCACTKPRFDVDPFGRLYIPNAITFQVSVRDNAGNEIARFGAYGNFDAQGPKSKEPKPDIPLGWPLAVGASDRFIYVGDCLNHRVVRVAKSFAAEALCPIAQGAPQ
ncbi:MAG TPA: hypothetical protein VNE39_21350 [Planctomycetota bacterium]|nr:hypothetical protein [Planctomycetota bacterium]